MKMRTTPTLYGILSFAFILMMGVGQLSAQFTNPITTSTANTLQHPKDQIALQLGAIQMGYTVPFTLTGNISVQKMQQAVNALVMGRNALDATVAKPAVKVQGAVNSPNVETVEYRDQLYSAVEYVVTSPVVATIKGNATLTGNKKVSVAATKLTLPTNAWTIPVPYSLEARSSADAQDLAGSVTALTGSQTELSANVATLANSQNTLSSNFTALQTQTSGLSSNLTAVQAQVTSVSNITSEALASVQTISPQIVAMQAEFKVIGLIGNMSFGDNTTTSTLTVTNSGFGRLNVSGITYPSGFSGSWSGAIAAGGSQDITVTFNPEAVQNYSGNIVVASDATSGVGATAVSGQGVRNIELSGNLLFGSTMVGVASQGILWITNTGTMDLTVSGITYPSGFSGSWSGAIAAGAWQSVAVTFTPTEVQSYSGNITVNSNAAGGDVRWAVSGVGEVFRPLAILVPVAGGTLPQSSLLGRQTVSSFQIGKYEVTWGEWKRVCDWAATNNRGYDLAGVGEGSGDDFPVTSVSWYDVVKWCNAKSEMEGKNPVYRLLNSYTPYRTGEIAPWRYPAANGYRLPSEREWEWAARGGVSGVSHNYVYSGSNDANDVAWTGENSSDETKTVGTKGANELGIYDMSGNVREWCEDFTINPLRRVRGGSSNEFADYASVAYRDYVESLDFRNRDIGFRLARSSGN